MSEANYPEVQLQEKIWEHIWWAETFTPLETHEMKYVSLKLEPFLYIEGVTASIQYAPGGVPTGTDLATAGVGWATLEKYPQNKTILFAFYPPWRLIAGIGYAIVIRTKPMWEFRWCWFTYEEPPGHYPRGKLIKSENSGITWDPTDRGDMFFAEWGNPPAIPSPVDPPLDKFAVMDCLYTHWDIGLVITLATNVPCHLTCYYTDKKPLKHHRSRIVRGLTVPWGTYFCFVAWKELEQLEYGATLYHTFNFTEWVKCQTKWFTFRGEVDLESVPSVGPIFEHHHPGPPPLLTEEQTTGIHWSSILDYGSWGQKLTISNRLVSKLSFRLARFAFPAGEVWFRIRRFSDGFILWEKKLMNAMGIDIIPAWYELDIDPPLLINEEVRLETMATPSGSTGNTSVFAALTDVKPNEHLYFRRFDGVYTEYPDKDYMYIYTYKQY